MTTMWKMTDVAGSSPNWAPSRVRKAPTRANANVLYGNTTANAYNHNAQSGGSGVGLLYPATGVFAIQDSQMSVKNDGVLSVTISSPGSGALAIPIITLTGGENQGGTPANTATATTTAQLVKATANAGGSGYAPGDHLTTTGGTGTQAVVNVVTVTANVVTSVSVITAGAWSVMPTINATPTTNTTGVGTGCTLVSSFGAGPNATMTANGTGYHRVPLVNITASGLVGAHGTANLISAALNQGVAHTGWILRKVGTGGRAGRIQDEVLVAGGITGTANNTTQYPVA